MTSPARIRAGLAAMVQKRAKFVLTTVRDDIVCGAGLPVPPVDVHVGGH